MFKVLLIDVNRQLMPEGQELLDLDIFVPPIGLKYIESYLEKKFKNLIKIKVISRVVDYSSEEELLEILKNYKPDCVGLRALSAAKDEFHLTAKLIKEYKKEIMTIGGGPYAMSVEQAINDDHVDCLVLGEGEVTFSEVVDRILHKQSIHSIRGIAYRLEGKIIVNSPQPFIQDLDSLDFPHYAAVEFDTYSHYASFVPVKHKWAPILSSRGCPYECIYCHNIFGKKFRARSPENVLDEMEKLHGDFGVDNFHFLDDSFNLDYKRAIRIFDLIIRRKKKYRLYLPNGIRGDVIDKNFIDKMIEAGVIWVSYAIETASGRLQRLIKKFADINKIAANIHYTCEKDIMVNCFFMVGFPTETEEEALGTVDFMRQFKKVTVPYFNSVKCFPSTGLFDLALSHGQTDEKMKILSKTPYFLRAPEGTPTLPESSLRKAYFIFLRDIFMSRTRILNAIRIQEKFFSKEQILDFYSNYFRRRIEDFKKDLLDYAAY